MTSTLIMGVVNVTPDSFSDGGQFLDPVKAVDQCCRLVDQGADIIDIGAESTRPGAEFVTYEEEWRRLEPVLNSLQARDLGCLVSVDTNKPEVIQKLVRSSVDIINNVKGAAVDEDLLGRLAIANKTYVAMHMHRQPSEMQQKPLDGSRVIEEVDQFFDQTCSRLKSVGFQNNAVWLDPGIGFGKTDEANLKLIKKTLLGWGEYEILIGISRKSFLGRLLDLPDPLQRDAPSKMLELAFMCSSIKAIRTHDVLSLNKIRHLLS